MTKWTKLDTMWQGVSLDVLLEGSAFDAAYAMVFADGEYTTNLPVADITGGKAWIATSYGGRELAPEHGGPARLLVPHLYFWKSAKWVRGLQFQENDEPGFWERLGYNNYRGSVAGTAVLGRLSWLEATVRDVLPENAGATTLVLHVEDWQGHRPGQHVDVRLTADDGYQAERSYSIASAPDDPALALTVERIDDGEVSPWMSDEARTGDSFELRGPVGGYFVWDDSEPAAVLLVGGGSGVVPLMSMARHRARRRLRTRMRLLYSARSADDLLYRGELDAMAAAGDGFEVLYTLTRTVSAQWSGFRRRVDAQMLADVSYAERETSPAFVCGPTPFVEAVSKGLVLVGYGAGRVKTERFGPSGGDA